MVFDSIVSYIVTQADLNYIEGDGYTYAMQAIIWSSLCGISSTLLKCLANYLSSKSSQRSRDYNSYTPLLNDESGALRAQEDHDNSLLIDELKSFIRESKVNRPTTVKVVMFIANALTIASVLCFAVAPSVLSSVGIISIFASTTITFLIFLLVEILVIKSFCPSKARALMKTDQYRDLQSNKPQLIREMYCAYKLYPCRFIFIAIIGIIYVAVVPQITAKSCMAYYSPKGTVAFGPFWISTAFSRWLSVPKVCPHGKICHIYSTLPEDSATSVILNVHTGIDVTNLQASYDTTSNYQAYNSLGFNKTGIDLKMEIDVTGERYIHSIYVDGLTSNTDYYVQFLYNGDVLGNATFRTLPSSDMEANIVMLVGGDSSGSEISTTFIQESAKYKPSVVLVGGDIVYDNGDFNCYYCWDYYLDQFDQLNQQVGRLIPLVLAVGNHDIGQNDFQFLNLDKNKNYFFLLFPQHTTSNASEPQVPLPDDRLSYFYHKIGNMLHVSLDSGYLVDYDSQQTWLSDVSRQNPNLAKLANYHVPMIPACFFNPYEYGFDPRVHSWVQVFELYRYMTVFENHVHLFKRTFPLKMTDLDGPGVTYIGDGAWGINPESCYEEDPNRNITGVFDTMGNVNHVWIVNVTAETIDYKAINITGDAIDTHSQRIADYVW